MNKTLLASILLLTTLGCTKKDILVTGKIENSSVSIQTIDIEGTAAEYVAVHHSLMDICNMAGGCQNVKVYCVHYDGTGNTILRNTIFWHIEALGVEGEAYYDDGHSSKGVIERAIADWKEAYKYKYAPQSDVSVYPNESPCDKNCMNPQP